LKLQKRRVYYESGWVQISSVPHYVTAVPIATRLLWRHAVCRVSTRSPDIATNWIKLSLSLVPAILHLLH